MLPHPRASNLLFNFKRFYSISASICVKLRFTYILENKLRYRDGLRYPIYPIEADDLAEFVEFPDADVVAVGAELPELEALLALGLVAVRAHAAGVVVAACMLEARYL